MSERKKREFMKNKVIKQLMICIATGVLLAGCNISGTEQSESASSQETVAEATQTTENSTPESTEEKNQAETETDASTESKTDEKDDGLSVKGDAKAQSLSQDPEFLIYSFPDWVYDESDMSDPIMKISYPTLSIGNDTSSGQVLSKVVKQTADQCKAQADEFRKSFESMAKDEFKGANWENDSYVYGSNGYARRIDSRVFSMLEEVYSYANGAHGNTYFNAYNYDLTTGNEIKLDDVVKDKTALFEAVKKNLWEKYDTNIFYSEETLKLALHDLIDGDMSDYLVFTIEADGVSFWFNDTSISAFLDGCQVATIPFKGNESIFNEAYISGQDDYVKEVVPGMLCQIASGHTVEIAQYGSADSSNTDFIPAIRYDGKEKVLENVYCSDLRAYLVHKSGKDYLYCQTEEDSEDHYLRIFTLGGEQLGDFRSPEKFGALNATLVDPNNFEMFTRVDALATMFPIANYSVGEEGMPVAKDSYYTLPDSIWNFTLLKDLTADVAADKNADSYTSEILPAGTQMTIIRTNAENWVDLELKDGRVVRLTFDFSAYPHVINGINEDELFDGIFYCD